MVKVIFRRQHFFVKCLNTMELLQNWIGCAFIAPSRAFAKIIIGVTRHELSGVQPDGARVLGG